MTETRARTMSATIADIENRVNNHSEIFESLPHGYRMLMLLLRTKDGGHNKEHKRIKRFLVFKDLEGFQQCLFELLLLKEVYGSEYRIYMSVNSRSLQRSLHHLETLILDHHYCGDEGQVNDLQRKIFTDARTFLMQPACRETKYFMLDVDDEPDKDVCGDVLKLMAENKVEEVYRKKSRNGWHIVTRPFNPKLFGDKENIVSKDGLILIE